MTRATIALRSMAMEIALRTRQSRIGLGTRGLPALSVTSSTTDRPTLGHMWMMRFDGPLHTFTLAFALRSGASWVGTKSIRSTAPESRAPDP